MPSLRSASTSAHSSWRTCGSSPTVGSSRSTSRGPVDERARDQQPPPHAARELVDARVAPVDELRHLERALDRVVPLGAADAVEVGEDEQVLLHGQRHVEVVELRHDAAARRAPAFDSSGRR